MTRSIDAGIHVVLSWSCLLLLACSSVPRIAAAQSVGDDAAIRTLVEKFFDLHKKRDPDGLMALWSEKSPDFVARRQLFRKPFIAYKFHLKSLTIRQINVNNDNASVHDEGLSEELSASDEV